MAAKHNADITPWPPLDENRLYIRPTFAPVI
jgi:hypothetical protein